MNVQADEEEDESPEEKTHRYVIVDYTSCELDCNE
jgi:hypothetical protein